MEDRSVKIRRKQDMYRALVQSGDGSDDNDEDNAQDMEVTFNTGLEDISKRILEKDKKSETVWESYLRKRKEKKKAWKNRSKNSSDEESSDTEHEHEEQLDDFFVEEETQVRSTKRDKPNQETVQEAEASRAELELLLADDMGTDNNLKGYNLKPKKGKGKKGKEIPDEGKIPDVNYDDPRFSSLFTSPLFALDPTDPQFKRSAVYARQMAQKKKGGQENATGTLHSEISGHYPSSDKLENLKDKDLQPDRSNLEKEKDKMSSMIKSVQMNTKQAYFSSRGKVMGKGEPLGVKAKTSKSRRMN
ncbi:pre-rRNA-proCES [Forsythia ovata]